MSTAAPTAAAPSRSLAPAFLAVAAVTLWRVIELALDAPTLSFDEAQYWAWAQTLQLGYYSKPPMVAWSIAATTALCGEAPGCVKLGSTLAHAGTACLLALVGRALYGRTVGLWSGLLWITLPAVSLSAMMITTDPFLLLFWALALLALVRAAEAGPQIGRWWLLLGVAFGLGLLAKYAMVLFLPSVLLWMAWSPSRRPLLKAPGLLAAVGMGLAIYAPNAIWNALNGFVSYKHTKDNAHLEGALLHPDKLVEFVGGQFGVFGPLLMLGLLAALWRSFRDSDGTGDKDDDRRRLLVAFTLPVLLLMTGESLLSRANANWTAPAYLAGTVLAAAFLATRAPALLKASLALHLLVAGAMYEMDAVRVLLGLPDSARFDPAKRVKGWEVIGARVSEILAAHPGTRLLGDERKTIASLIYHVRPHPFDAVKWNPTGRINDHFDQTTGLTKGDGPFIYVTESTRPEPVIASFAQADRLTEIRVAIHADYERHLQVWRLSDFKGFGG